MVRSRIVDLPGIGISDQGVHLLLPVDTPAAKGEELFQVALPLLKGRHPRGHILARGDDALPVLDIESPHLRPRSVCVGAFTAFIES